MDAAGTAGERQNLACPRCAGALSARHYHDLDVDECDACGGFMLSPSAIDRIVAAKDNATDLRLALPARAAAAETAVHYIRCPVCSEIMNRKAFGRISGVVVDVCAKHGVWFDAGELAAVLAFVARGGLTRAREREQAELESAARALRREQREVGLSHAVAGEPLGGDFVRALAGLWS
jgi:Zn-finger nucleic acid-binding protein